MTIEVNKLKIISETPDQTRIRLADQTVKLTNQRIDLERIKREGINPAWHSMISRFPGTLEEAIHFNNNALFKTWLQIRDTEDNLLVSIAEQERGRLRDFFNQPLDDR